MAKVLAEHLRRLRLSQDGTQELDKTRVALTVLLDAIKAISEIYPIYGETGTHQANSSCSHQWTGHGLHFGSVIALERLHAYIAGDSDEVLSTQSACSP